MNYKDLLEENEKRNTDIQLLRKNGWTLDKIGKEFGITRERVRQILSAVDTMKVKGLDKIQK